MPSCVIPISSYLQSFPASGAFPMNQFCTEMGINLQEMGNQTTIPASWEIFMHVKKQQLEPDMEQQTVSKWGKEYVKAVYSRGNTIYPHSSVGKESACSAGDPGEGIGYPLQYSWAQMVKNLLAMWETLVRSLGWEDPLERGKATHSCNLAGRIPWTI